MRLLKLATVCCSLLSNAYGFQRVPVTRLNTHRKSISARLAPPSTHATSAGQFALKELRSKEPRKGASNDGTSRGRKGATSERRRLPNLPPGLFLPVALAMLFFSTSLAQPANAAYGSSGAAVTSPAVVKSLTLEEFLNLPEKKQRQFEGEVKVKAGLTFTATFIVIFLTSDGAKTQTRRGRRRLPIVRRDVRPQQQGRKEEGVQARERNRRSAQRHAGGREEVPRAVQESYSGRGRPEGPGERGAAEAKRRVAE